MNDMPDSMEQTRKSWNLRCLIIGDCLIVLDALLYTKGAKA
jgi:hypothetical protein